MTEIIILAMFIGVVSAVFRMRYVREMRSRKLKRIQREIARREAQDSDAQSDE